SGHAEISARARLVLDDELLSELFRKLLRDQAPSNIGDTTGRKRDDDLDRLCRILLRERRTGNQQRRAECDGTDDHGHGNFSLVHSILSFASRTTLPHFAISVLIRAPNSSGLLITGIKPSVSSFSRTSGIAPIFAISVCSRSTISFGVPAGTTI